MRIVDADDNIIKELRRSEISSKMNSLETCKWLVLEERDGKIIGAVGLGGLFHVSSIQIDENHQGKGIGKMLQGKMIEEAKRRGYSFITIFIDPRNPATVKLHDFYGYRTVFRIHYSPDIVQDVKILVFKSKGEIVAKFLSIFNTHFGIVLLAFILRVTKFLFARIIAHTSDVPNPSLRWIIKNFEKI